MVEVFLFLQKKFGKNFFLWEISSIFTPELKLNNMNSKQKKEIVDKKIIQRVIEMYISVHGEEPKSCWCTSVDRAKFLLSYYKEQYNIIG